MLVRRHILFVVAVFAVDVARMPLSVEALSLGWYHAWMVQGIEQMEVCLPDSLRRVVSKTHL